MNSPFLVDFVGQLQGLRVFWWTQRWVISHPVCHRKARGKNHTVPARKIQEFAMAFYIWNFRGKASNEMDRFPWRTVKNDKKVTDSS